MSVYQRILMVYILLMMVNYDMVLIWLMVVHYDSNLVGG